MARPRASDACISDVDFIFAPNRQHWSVTHPHTRSSVHKRKIASMAIDTHALSAERHCRLTRSPLCSVFCRTHFALFPLHRKKNAAPASHDSFILFTM